MKYTKVLGDEIVIGHNFLGRAEESAATGIEYDDLIGNIERQMPVLFDQDDRLTFVLEAADGSSDLRDYQRSKAFRRFVQQ